jgi:hypothetical protein
MCGPSSAETSLASGAQSMSSQLSANYSSTFGDQSAILGHLNNVLSPISQAGPDQQGFGANELAALNTGANQGVGRSYAKASQSLNNSIGAEGGGNEVAPNGAAEQRKQALASSAADTMSNADLGITEANYSQGRKNWDTANSGLQQVAQQYNPNATAGAANASSQTAFSDAQANQAASNAWVGDLTGLVGGLGGAALGNPSLFKCWVAAEVYGGWDDPRTTLVRNYLGNVWSKTFLGGIVCNLYLLVGPEVAAIIRAFPLLRKPFKALFDIALRKSR